MSYKLAVIGNNLTRDKVKFFYLNAFEYPSEDTAIIQIYIEPGKKKKAKASDIKQWISEVFLPFYEKNKVDAILCTDANYFKKLAGVTKVSDVYGYVYDCTIADCKVVYCPDYRMHFYNPEDFNAKGQLALFALKDYLVGSYSELGSDVIREAYYPTTYEDIKKSLETLLAMNKPLSADIEAYSLKHYSAGIGSIAFSWNEHEGIAFPVDFLTNHEPNEPVRALLRDFFERFEQPIIWHNIAYDAYVLIYQLYMKSLGDYEGLLKGLNIMLKNWEDTKLIAYLATNSCSGNTLGLKPLSHEYTGNYAVDVHDIREQPLEDLLKYNLIDTMATWYVYNKYQPKLIEDKQEDIYNNIFKPATKDIIQMQLTGLPLDMETTIKANEVLIKDREEALASILNNPLTKEAEHRIKEEWVKTKNSKLKTKQVSIEDCKETFNANSGNHVRTLLFDVCGLVPTSTTSTGQPSTDKKALEDLKNQTDKEDIKNLLQAFLDYSAVDKIITAFMPCFLGAIDGGDGRHYVYGSIKLGGTVSGRLSASDPNVMQFPATGSKYAKLIKGCFQAPEGWLFVGSDYSSLEDRISALTTKDPEKLKPYLEAYDGHCLRAYSYFKEDMPDITAELQAHPEDEVNIINSIKHRYKDLRQKSKGPTFALTYGGTYKALMSIFGFSESEAKSIEARYHELYKVSDKWVRNHVQQACIDGYVTCAFGLRVRTPMLKQTVLTERETPREALSEMKTAGNALGQSYCLLTVRAGSEFAERVRNSKFKYDIKPCNIIHDALYYIIKDNPETIEFVNNNLLDCMGWQEDEAIYHPDVKLLSELSIFYPSWAQEMELKPNSTQEEIINQAMEYMNGKH